MAKKCETSSKSKEAAKKFIIAVKSGKIKKDTLPNNAKCFHGVEERVDFEHFCEFAESDFYKELLDQ